MNTLVLKNSEIDILLSQIDSKDLYDDIMMFIDTRKQQGKFPCSTDDFKEIAMKAYNEADESKGKTSRELRK